MADEPRPDELTVGDIRAQLEADHATWSVADDLRDEDPVPEFPAGVSEEALHLLQLLGQARGIRHADFETYLRQRPPTSPFLVDAWIARGLLPESSRDNLSHPPVGPYEGVDPDELYNSDPLPSEESES